MTTAKPTRAFYEYKLKQLFQNRFLGPLRLNKTKSIIPSPKHKTDVDKLGAQGNKLLQSSFNMLEREQVRQVLHKAEQDGFKFTPAQLSKIQSEAGQSYVRWCQKKLKGASPASTRTKLLNRSSKVFKKSYIDVPEFRAKQRAKTANRSHR